jgi:hypothetical protein
MSQISTTVRERIQAQGFRGLDDVTYAHINYPLRLSPAIVMVWVAVGTALASPTILWVLVPFAALGAVLTGSPFDVLYNNGLRHLLGSPVLPRYGARRRFGFAVATTMIVATACAFQAGLPLLGYIVGGAIVASACVQVSTGICGSAVLVGRLFGKVVCSELERYVPLEPSERASDCDRLPILARSIRGLRMV